MAGLSFALRMAEYSNVMIITKGFLEESNSSNAQGGIAAVINATDNFDLHIGDTITVGQGLCNRKNVELLVSKGASEIEWLIRQGVEFDKRDGELELSREGGHSKRRVVHAGDITGNEVQKVLIKKVRENSRILIKERVLATDLIVKDNRCVGVSALSLEDNKVIEVFAENTVLATGGVGQLFAKTSNPDVATGDGIAMAWRVGAFLTDMEFVQFHPSILDVGDPPYFLISEAVRGEGGVLLNSENEAFMTRYHALQDLAPRDVVSRAIVEEQKKGQVFIDIRHRGEKFIKDRFPVIYNECLERGIRMERDLIPVSPAAHYMCGGILINEFGETNIDNLYAFGECACTGVHGANRLASNSLLECLVFTHNAVEKLAPISKESAFEIVEKGSFVSKEDNFGLRGELQEIMWTFAGINRSLDGLNEGRRRLGELSSRFSAGLCRDQVELGNLLDVACLVIKSSLYRRESRGTHFLLDFPVRDDANWLRHTIIQGESIFDVLHEQ